MGPKAKIGIKGMLMSLMPAKLRFGVLQVLVAVQAPRQLKAPSTLSFSLYRRWGTGRLFRRGGRGFGGGSSVPALSLHLSIPHIFVYGSYFWGSPASPSPSPPSPLCTHHHHHSLTHSLTLIIIITDSLIIHRALTHSVLRTHALTHSHCLYHSPSGTPNATKRPPPASRAQAARWPSISGRL